MRSSLTTRTHHVVAREVPRRVVLVIEEEGLCVYVGDRGEAPVRPTHRRRPLNSKLVVFFQVSRLASSRQQPGPADKLASDRDTDGDDDTGVSEPRPRKRNRLGED